MDLQNRHSGETEESLDFFKGATVFADGILYIRYGETLMAYNIKES